MIMFLLGGLFLYCGIPVLDGLISLICSIIKVIETKIQIKITEHTQTITKLQNEKINNNPIGFQDNKQGQ